MSTATTQLLNAADLSALLQKYSKPGPRYTSYPTAPYFHSGFQTSDWQQVLAQSSSKRGISLYLHIPFCDSLCYYCGCNMVVTHQYNKAAPYLASLDAEMAATAKQLDKNRLVEQLHLGGGTPTFLQPDDLRRLMDSIRKYFTIAENAEIACEIDPRELTREHLVALRENGFNRVSFGVQDMNPEVQAAVNRLQSTALIEQVLAWTRELGFASINLDLIVGLPKQTVHSFHETLQQVTAWKPERLAVFAYAHVPWMKKHQKLIKETDLPDFATRLALQNLVYQELGDAGYTNIGMDHFGLAHDELVLAQQSKTLWRNFQGYTTHKNCDIIAFGASSISQISGDTPSANAYMQNIKSVRMYQDSVNSSGQAVERGLLLTREDMLRRDAITRIMCDLEIQKSAFAKDWGIDFDSHFADSIQALQPLADDGFVALQQDSIQVTELGRLFLRNIGMCFDAYLQAPKTTIPIAPQYSKTV